MLNRIDTKLVFQALIVVMALILLSLDFASASANPGETLPFEAPMEKFVNSITGPIAFGVSLIGLVGAGALLIFGSSEMNVFLKTFIFIILVICMLIFAKNFMSTLFGKGALITLDDAQVAFNYQINK